MSDTIADRVRRYVLDGGDEDLRRLLGVSHVGADMTRSAMVSDMLPPWLTHSKCESPA